MKSTLRIARGIAPYMKPFAAGDHPFNPDSYLVRAANKSRLARDVARLTGIEKSRISTRLAAAAKLVYINLCC